MNTTHPIIYTVIIMLLTACASLDQPITEVDRISLLRSMTYSHRQLVEMQLQPNPVEDTNRKSLLLNIHCDLIDRGLVYAKQKPTVCQKTDNPKDQICIAKFHRCIGECPTFKQRCERCEKLMERCVGSGD